MLNHQDFIPLEVVGNLQHVQHVAAVKISTFAIEWYLRRKRSRKDQISRHIKLENEKFRISLMKLIENNPNVRHIIRMGPQAFHELCSLLIEYGGLRHTQRATVEEQVAKFLWLIGHNISNRELAFFFRRSGETVSRHFHYVLRAVIELVDLFIIQPNGNEIPDEILNNTRFYPYFKDCVGAIDGTHIRVKVSTADAPRFRGRKQFPTQNVLVAASFDLKVTYVLTGWEGTASDSRIIKNAFTRTDPLKIPSGKYYLVDAGFMLKGSLITPYRGVRYHLKEFSRSNPPLTSQELFNLRHSSLRNAIEHTFGIVKKRFPIIASGNEPHFKIRTLNKIIVVCCIIHNFLMGVDPDWDLIDEVNRVIANEVIAEDTQNGATVNDNDHDTAIGEYIRDTIALAMWQNYNQ